MLGLCTARPCTLQPLVTSPWQASAGSGRLWRGGDRPLFGSFWYGKRGLVGLPDTRGARNAVTQCVPVEIGCVVARSDTALCQKSDRNNIGENKSSSVPVLLLGRLWFAVNRKNGSADACRNGRAQVRFGASRPTRRPAGGSCPSALIYNAPRSAAAPRAPVVDLRRPVFAGRRTRLRHGLRRLHVRGDCKFPESD